MTIRMRQEVEHKIVKAVIKQLLGTGCYTLGVNNGEETILDHCQDAALLEQAMFTTDEDRLLVFIKDGDPKDWLPDYWVRFVYGNDGYDVISDYSVGLEKDLTDASQLSDYYGGEGEYRPFSPTPHPSI